MHVLIADPNLKIRRALTMLLKEEPGFNAIYQAPDAACLLELAIRETIDIVLLAVELPGRPIKDLIDDLHALIPSPKIIVMSSDLEQGRQYLRDGADAFFSKSDQPDWLLTILRSQSGSVVK